MIFYFSNWMAQWIKLKTSSDRVHIDTLFKKDVRKTFRKLSEEFNTCVTTIHQKSDQFYFYDVSLHLQETKTKVLPHQWSISPEHSTTFIPSKTSYVQMFELFRECARFGCFFHIYTNILLCGEVYWHYIISCYFFLIKCNSIQFYSTP